MSNKQIFKSMAASNFEKLKDLIDKGYEETSEFLETINSLSIDLENTARVIKDGGAL